MRFLFQIIFWGIYFPLIRLINLFLFWNSKVEDRERFEKRNKFEALAHSFKEKNETADLCFEFSSEGEYQQIAPLVDDALKVGKKIELVFFSPSVEKGVMRLAAQYPKQIRYLRFPLVRIFPFIPRRSFTHWVTAKKLIMVRYDLFPELLLWSLKKDHELKILWMTFKKERTRGHGPSLWKKLFLKAASGIVYAGAPDLKQGEVLGFKGKAFDFRIEQIKRRMEKKADKFRSQFIFYPVFKNHVESFPQERRLIMGNAWPSDLFLLKDLPPDVLLVIVPHQLSEEILGLFREGLDNLGREVFECFDGTEVFRPSSTILINKKGILCELYADFQFSYVGGGFEGSIHSVLEPLVAGSTSVSCGPFHHRSTEYDIALDLNRISEVNTPEQFSQWLKIPVKETDHARMKSLVSGYESFREFVISC
jgi:3-deoxy-D-manno-octulosonic-acid transferase